MAERMFAAYLKEKQVSCVEVASAGFINPGLDMSENSKKVLRERGLSYEGHVSKLVDKKLYDSADYIFTMSKGHKDELLRQFGARENVFAFSELVGSDVPDPYMLDISHYRFAAEKIEAALPHIAQKAGLE